MGAKSSAGFRNVLESIDRDGVVGPYLEMAVQMGVNCAIGGTHPLWCARASADSPVNIFGIRSEHPLRSTPESGTRPREPGTPSRNRAHLFQSLFQARCYDQLAAGPESALYRTSGSKALLISQRSRFTVMPVRKVVAYSPLSRDCMVGCPAFLRSASGITPVQKRQDIKNEQRRLRELCTRRGFPDPPNGLLQTPLPAPGRLQCSPTFPSYLSAGARSLGAQFLHLAGDGCRRSCGCAESAPHPGRGQQVSQGAHYIAEFNHAVSPFPQPGAATASMPCRHRNLEMVFTQRYERTVDQ